MVRLCEALAERGLAVDLAALAGEAQLRFPAFAKGFPVSPGPARLGHSGAMRRWLARQAASGKVDIVHNHGLWMMPNLYAGWAARKPGVALVVSPRGTLSREALAISRGVKSLFWPLLQRPAIAHAACFHATAAHELADIRRLGFTQPVAVIPNGIDLPPPADLRERGDKTLLYLGRLHPIKGLDLLLRAWADLGRESGGWRLVIAGPAADGYGEELRQLAGELGCRRVEFPGPVYGAEKLALYREAALSILPSRSENFGMSVAESLAAGTPCISTWATPWRGLEEHRAGWCVAVEQEALSACLKTALAKTPGELRAMGRNGRDWMAREYAWERVGAMMDAAYHWVKQGGDAPPWVAIGGKG